MKTFGVTEVGEIKIQARKEGTHSIGFLKYVTKFLTALNAPVNISLGKTTLLTKHM